MSPRLPTLCFCLKIYSGHAFWIAQYTTDLLNHWHMFLRFILMWNMWTFHFSSWLNNIHRQTTFQLVIHQWGMPEMFPTLSYSERCCGRFLCPGYWTLSWDPSRRTVVGSCVYCMFNHLWHSQIILLNRCIILNL